MQIHEITVRPIQKRRHPINKLFISLLADAVQRDEESTRKLFNLK